jgi:hypothetical protein
VNGERGLPAPPDGISSSTPVSVATPLQSHWLDVRAAIDAARLELDADTFQTWLAMLTILVARLSAEQAEREWRAAA